MAVYWLASCTAEKADMQPEDKPASGDRICLVFSMSEPTKTTITGKTVNWAEGDEVKIIRGTGTDDQTTAKVSLEGGRTSISADVAMADFYYAIYPASATASLQLPVPNYYWKAFLKVKWSGSTVTSASAIGFWFEHKQYDNSNYANYAVSVDYIEQMTGFDLFANLSGDNSTGIEKTAEANTSWTAFQNF